MNSKSWILSLTLAASLLTELLTAYADQAPASDLADGPDKGVGAKLQYAVVEASGHYNVLQANEIIADEDGTTSTNLHRIVELGSGLNYFNNDTQRWEPAVAEFEIDGNAGAIARRLYQQVQISGDPSQPAAVTVTTPDLQQLKSHIVGLSLFDPVTGAQEMIAELKKAPQGNLLGTKDKIVFSDCFDSLNADLVYEITQGSFSQDVILRQQIDPADWKFPAGSILEIWTEFDEAPEPRKDLRIVSQESDPDIRAGMVEPNQTDETLFFGDVLFSQGQAFEQSDHQAVALSAGKAGGVLVTKRFLTIDGRKFLVEGISMKNLAVLQKDLPQVANGQAAQRREIHQNRKALAQSIPKNRSGSGSKPLSVARATMRLGGVVLDYTTLSTVADLTLASGTTYYLNSGVTVSGTTTIEGGAVIKYTTNLSTYLAAYTVDCRTSPARPAIFTSSDDNSVGETISGSTGVPLDGLSGNAALFVVNSFGELHDIRISYARYALYCQQYTPPTGNNVLRNVQITHASQAITLYGYPDGSGGNWYAQASLYNVLIDTAANAFYGHLMAMDGTHVTLNNIGNATLHDAQPGALGTLTLTNSLLVAISNPVTNVTTTACTSYASASSVFQTLGAGAVYNRADVSNPCNTNGLPVTLLADLKLRTVFPPTILTNPITTDLTLSTGVARDNGSTVACGYHYWPLDYVVSGLVVSNATLTVTNGLTIGWYGTNAIQLSGSGKVVSQGGPTAKNYFVRYNTVQEQANTNWNSSTNLILSYADSSSTSSAEVRFNFTEATLPGGVGQYFKDRDNLITLRNSEFYGGDYSFGGSAASDHVNGFTNNLFYQARATLSSAGNHVASYMWNNLFKGGYQTNSPPQANTWEWRDNVFDSLTLYSLYPPATNSHNAFTTNVTVFTNNLGNNLTNFVPSYQTGPLGYFYQATNSAVTNKGSRYATNAGLFWFTITTNQVIETNTVVDIGYHYVGLNASNQPFDNDGDAIPSYLEDANGNGALDSGETDWTNANDLGLKVWITRPRNGSSIP